MSAHDTKSGAKAPRQDIHNSEVPNLCRSCEARHRGICGALKDSELVQLSRHTTRKTVEAGTQMQGEAETMGSYANILSGVVKLTRVMSDGRQQIVDTDHAVTEQGDRVVEGFQRGVRRGVAAGAGLRADDPDGHRAHLEKNRRHSSR